MGRAARTLPGVTGIVALIALAGCAMTGHQAGSAGGGVLNPFSNKPGPMLVEVRGYVLAPSGSVPQNAIGYAVPVFTTRQQAMRFCPAFLKRLNFEGMLDARTKLMARTYGQTVQIAPFVWPVTNWGPDDKADCATLVQRYNISGARIFHTLALNAINRNGGGPAHALTDGPFIVTARRVSGTTMIFDLSRAPDNDYDKWLVRSAEQLTNPTLTGQTYVTPTWRDRMRYYVFGSVDTFQGVIDVLIPGFSAEHRRS